MCFYCHQVGHHSKECDKKVCYICSSKHHISRRCPKKGLKAELSSACGNFKQEEHVQRVQEWTYTSQIQPFSASLMFQSQHFQSFLKQQQDQASRAKYIPIPLTSSETGTSVHFGKTVDKLSRGNPNGYQEHRGSSPTKHELNVVRTPSYMQPKEHGEVLYESKETICCEINAKGSNMLNADAIFNFPNKIIETRPFLQKTGDSSLEVHRKSYTQCRSSNGRLVWGEISNKVKIDVWSQEEVLPEIQKPWGTGLSTKIHELKDRLGSLSTDKKEEVDGMFGFNAVRNKVEEHMVYSGLDQQESNHTQDKQEHLLLGDMYLKDAGKTIGEYRSVTQVGVVSPSSKSLSKEGLISSEISQFVESNRSRSKKVVRNVLQWLVLPGLVLEVAALISNPPKKNDAHEQYKRAGAEQKAETFNPAENEVQVEI